MMVEVSTVLTIAGFMISCISLSLSVIAILKIMATERATHTIYNQGQNETPAQPINTEELFKDVTPEPEEFTEKMSINTLEKSLLGDFE